MLKSKWVLFAVAVVAAIAVAVTAFWFFAIEPNSYIAKVGDQKITRGEYNIYKNLIKYQLSETYGLTDWNTVIQGEKASESVKKMALDQAVETKILLAKAKDAKISLTKEELAGIDTQIKEFETQNKGRAEAQKLIKKQLEASIDQYKTFLINDALTKKYVQSVYDVTKITDDEAKSKFDASPKDYDKVTVRHILFMTVGADGTTPLADDKIKAAEKNANDTLVKAKAGEDFATLAKNLSEDTGSKADGGKIEFGKGEMVTEFETWSFDTGRKAGDIDIVKTSYGYHVMKFESRASAAFADVKDNVKKDIINKKYSEEYPKNLDAWKKESQFVVGKNTKAYNSIEVKNEQ